MKKQNLIIAVALTALALPASFAFAGEPVDLHPIADVDILDAGTDSGSMSVDLAFDPIPDADFLGDSRMQGAECTSGQADLSFDPVLDVENL